jgi:DDE superfamily endonuclease
LFRTFCGLVGGFLAQAGRRTVCRRLADAGLPRLWPHDRAHQFFARARWNADDLGLAVARLVTALLVPAGQPVTLWLACRMAKMLAGALPGRRIHVVADAAYAGEQLKKLPPGITWTTRLRRDAALYDLPPARTGGRGRAPPKRRPAAIPGPARPARGLRSGRRHPLWEDRHRTPPPGITPPTSTLTAPAPPGTRPRPTRPPRTCSPSSAASSSPRNFGHLALTSRHPKKSMPSAWPGENAAA